MNKNNYLKVGEYILPDKCTAKKVGCRLIVYPKGSNVLRREDLRCMHCKHFSPGISVGYRQSEVCTMKPKDVAPDGTQRYYYCPRYGRACEHFEDANPPCHMPDTSSPQDAIADELLAFLRDCKQIDAGYFRKYMNTSIDDVIGWLNKIKQTTQL